MISNHLNLVEQQRQHTDSISERIAQFLAAGGRSTKAIARRSTRHRRSAQPTSIPKPFSSAASRPSHGPSVTRCVNSRRHYEQAQDA